MKPAPTYVPGPIGVMRKCCVVQVVFVAFKSSMRISENDPKKRLWIKTHFSSSQNGCEWRQNQTILPKVKGNKQTKRKNDIKPSSSSLPLLRLPVCSTFQKVLSMFVHDSSTSPTTKKNSEYEKLLIAFGCQYLLCGWVE